MTDGSHNFRRVNTDTHPTPVHIRGCIYEVVTEHNETAAARGVPEIPFVAIELIRAGIAEACRQHDTGL